MSSTHVPPTTAATPVRFIDDLWPVLVCVGPSRYDAAELQRMFDGFQRYFERNEPYVLVTHTPKGAEPMSARDRKAIADWANTPTVRAKSSALCIASASVIPSPIARGAMTALMWLWKPASPQHLAPTTEEAVDWCIAKLIEAGLPTRQPPDRLRAAVLDRVRSI